MTKHSPVRYFKTSPEVIWLTIWCELSFVRQHLRQQPDASSYLSGSTVGSLSFGQPGLLQLTRSEVLAYC